MTVSEEFQANRSRLQGLAYRMLGSVADAEDVIQDAYLRWHDVDRAAVDNPEAYLTTVVSRLCLDRLGEARRKREVYIGPWLPEPLLTSHAESSASAEDEELSRDISFALLLALERLSPLERAAFLLHDVFELSYSDIAATLNRGEAACRQLVTRARQHIQRDKSRYPVDADQNEQLASAFFRASRQGDIATLQKLLLDDAVLHADGGGQRTAARKLMHGASRICRFFAGLASKQADTPPHWMMPVTINGGPGVLSLEADGLLQAATLRIEQGRISDIYIVRNPEKLAHLEHLVPEQVESDRTH